MKTEDIMKIADTAGRTSTAAARNKDIICKEFANTVNKYSVENDSNTPDFIIAEYLFECLLAFNIAVTKRSIWYNLEDKK